MRNHADFSVKAASRALLFGCAVSALSGVAGHAQQGPTQATAAPPAYLES